MFLVGAGLLIYALKNRHKAAASAAWPQATGRVISANIEQRISHGKHGTHHYYEPVIEYEYNVAGTAFHSNRLAFGSVSGGRGRAEQTLARYAPGLTVVVYYNPENPAEAVLEREAKGGLLPIIIGVMFMGFGLIFGCVAGGLMVLVFMNS